MSMMLTASDIAQHMSPYRLFSQANDVDEICHRVGEVFRPHNLNVVGRGQRPRASMDHLAFRDVTINRLSYSAEVAINSEPFKNFILVMTPLRGSASVRCGKHEVQSTSRLASVVGPSTDLSMRWDADCDQFILRIGMTAIEKTCEAYLGRPLKAPIEFSVGLDLTCESSKLWKQVISLMLSNSELASSAASYPLIAAQVEQLLIGALLNCQPHQYQQFLSDTSVSISPGFIKRAEDFMTASVEEPVTMRDVAIHVGVSLRSLYAGFERYRNMSPKSFLRNKRLELVRQDLLEASLSGKPKTVTTIALARGFSHLGHFTRGYQQKYGELPSDTLKRRQRTF